MRKTIILLTSLLSVLTAGAQRVMTLKECIEMALERNINIKQYANQEAQQKLVLSDARHSRLPDLNASATQSFNFGRGLNSENNYVNRNTMNTGFALSTSMQLLTGGRIAAETAAGRLNLQAAAADLERTRQSLALQVTAAYLQAVYAAEMVKVQDEQVSLSKVLCESKSKMLSAGKVPESDLIEAQSQLTQDEMARTQARCDQKLALLDLSQLLEMRSPDSIGVTAPLDSVPSILPPLPDVIYAKAEGIKPEIAAERLRLQADEKNIRAARAALYPTLSLGAGLSSSYYKTSGFKASSFTKQLSDNFDKNIGLQLSIPIFNRFTTRNAISRARLQRDAQALKLDDTRKALYKEIQQAYYNALNAQAKYNSALAARTAAETNFKMMTGKYENGKANQTELAEAKTKRAKAITSCLQAKYEYILRMKVIRFYEGQDIS